MRQVDIQVGKTYYNRGKGRTVRTVLAIQTTEPRCRPVHVLYQQLNRGTSWLSLKMFAQWAGGEVDKRVAAET